MKDKRPKVTRRKPTKGVKEGRPYLRPPKDNSRNLPGKCNCLEILDKYQEDLEEKAKNAFNRSKWGMFAYYKSQAVHIRRVHLLIRKGEKLNVQKYGITE